MKRQHSSFLLLIVILVLFAGVFLCSLTLYAEEPVDGSSGTGEVTGPEGSESPGDIIDEIVEEYGYGSSVMVDTDTPYDLRTALSTGLGDAYNVLQGGCCDDEGYAYYAMMHNDSSNTDYYRKYCQIIKVRLSDLQVIKVSQPLMINHGNDLTYNPDTGYIYAIHMMDSIAENRLKISVIDKNTLEIVSGSPVEVTYNPAYARGISRDQFDSIVDFSGIAYNKINGVGRYALLIRYSCDILIVDENFRAVRYINEDPVTKRLFSGNSDSAETTYVTQGIDCNDDYILILKSKDLGQGSSPKKYDNIMLYYDWSGTFIKKLSIKGVSHEIENIFHTSYVDENGEPASTFYISCYVYNKLRSGIRFAYIYQISKDETIKYVDSVAFSKSSMSVIKGKVATCKADISPPDATYKKVIYESMNPSIVTISSNGIIHGAAYGKATVSATSADGNHTSSCRITVKPDAPIPVAPVNTTTGVTFSWTRVSGASGYYIYRRPYSVSGNYKQIATVSGSSLSYNDKTVVNGKRYLYTVASYVKTSYGNIISSKKPGRSVFYVKVPDNFRVKALSNYRLKAGWKPLSGVSGYQLTYSLKPNFKKQSVINIKKRTVKVTATAPLAEKKVYYLRLRAYKIVDGKKRYSTWSKVLKIRTRKEKAVPPVATAPAGRSGK